MKRILFSFLVVGAVVAMIGGATMAYFSDTATSNANSFQAGTLNFEIKSPGEAHRLFAVPDMKPGDVRTNYLAVVNDGTIPMKWKVDFALAGDLAQALLMNVTMYPTEGFNYATLEPAYHRPATWLSNHPLVAWAPVIGLSPLYWSPRQAGSPLLFQPGEYAVYKIEIKMDPNADDTYQGKICTGDISFFATQDENETW